MNRADALLYLQRQFSSMYARVGLATTDAPSGFGTVLDNAWSMLGLTVGTEVPIARVQEYEAALDWHALKRAAYEYVQKYSKAFAGMSLQTYQTFQGIRALLTDATKRLEAVGLVSPGGVAPYLASYNEIVMRPKRTVVRQRYVGGLTEFG